MRRQIIFLIVYLLAIVVANCQQVNTLYFMKDVPLRHKLNPAFQPTNDIYIGMPFLGYTEFNIGNNSFTLKDLIYKSDGKTVSFLNSSSNGVDALYDRLKSTTVINAGFETNLLSAGFRRDDAYWTFSLSEKMDMMIGLPKEFLKFFLYGTPEELGNNYNADKLQLNNNLYTEVAFGYAKKQPRSRWSIGGKAKLLIGSLHFSGFNDYLSLYAGIDNWNTLGKGTFHYSGVAETSFSEKDETLYLKYPDKATDWLKPSGLGLAIDLGFEYRFNDQLKLSASILDLGFIRWKNNTHEFGYTMDYTFAGLVHYTSNESYKDAYDNYKNLIENNLRDSIYNSFGDSRKLNSKLGDAYVKATTAKLNLGAEYDIVKDKISLGLLSRTYFYYKTYTTELTASLNTNPTQKLSTSLSYSFFEGRSSLGAGLGIRTGFLHWFVSADYIPFQTASYNLDANNSTGVSIPIPYNVKSVNFAMGVNFVLNSKYNVNKHRKTNRSSNDCRCNW